MTIHFKALPGVLLHPTETFKTLKKDANLADGLKLYLITMVIALVVTLPLTLMQNAKMLGELRKMGIVDVSSLGWVGQMMTTEGTIIMSVLGLVGGLVLVLAFCWLTTKFAKLIASKGGDFSRTTGLLCYTASAFELFVWLPVGIISAVVSMSMLTITTQPVITSGWMLASIVLLVCEVLVFIWAWLNAGRATAVANNTTWGVGIVSTFLSALVLGLVMFVAFMAAAVILFKPALSGV